MEGALARFSYWVPFEEGKPNFMTTVLALSVSTKAM